VKLKFEGMPKYSANFAKQGECREIHESPQMANLNESCKIDSKIVKLSKYAKIAKMKN
jgi:hypothetical protein